MGVSVGIRSKSRFTNRAEFDVFVDDVFVVAGILNASVVVDDATRRSNAFKTLIIMMSVY